LDWVHHHNLNHHAHRNRADTEVTNGCQHLIKSSTTTKN
jgi:hypothetical protein